MSTGLAPDQLCEWVYGADWLERFGHIKTLSAEELLAPLVRQLGPLEAERHLPQLMQYLREVCADTEIKLPNPVIKRLQRPAARLNEKSAAELDRLVGLERAFLGNLETMTLSYKDLLPAILFSAMRFGGCLQAKRIHALMLALRYLPKRYDQNYWFELDCDGIEAQIVWRPDPLTLCLMARWYTADFHKVWANRMPTAPTVHREVARLFRGQRDWSEHALSATALLNAISTRLSLDVAPIIVDCARGVIDNRPLKPSAFYRYLTGKSPRLVPTTNPGEPESERVISWNPMVAKAISSPKSATGDPAYWRDVRHDLRTERDRKQAALLIKKRLFERQGDLAPVSDVITAWILELLSGGNRWGSRLKPSSVGTLISSILSGLIALIGRSDVVTLSESEWEDVYSQILDEKGTIAARRNARKALVEFHQFLVANYGVSEFHGFVSSSAGKKHQPHVDANVLLEDEYDAIFDHFKRLRENASGEASWIVHTCQLIALILGYRCGLRRSEVHALRMSDIETGSRAEILLTGKRLVTLKSNAAYRRVPFSVLATSSELEVIREWVALRERTGATSDSAVFATDDSFRMQMNASDLFDPITLAMKVVTGDPSARFHHLRHSFATRKLYDWMRPDLANHKDLERICLERRRILGVREGTKPSRKVAKALHVMIGHASVDMTMTHYAHSVEWLLYDELHRMTPELSTSCLAQLSGLTERQVQRLASDDRKSAKDVQGNTSRALVRIVPEIDMSRWQAASAKRIPNFSRQRPRETPWVMDLWRAMLVFYTHGAGTDELAERFNISVDALTKSLERLEQLQTFRYGTAGHNYYRHRLPPWSGRVRECGMFPFPRQQRHFELALSIVERFQTLSDRQKPMVLWAVAYFLEHGSARNAYITFREKGPLKRFVRVLELLGLEATVIREGGPTKVLRYQLTLVTPAAKGSLEREQAWQFWATGLDLQRFQMRDQCAGASAQHGRIELRVLALKGGSKRKQGVHRRHQQPSDWGFRLGLYLLAIAYGWE